MKRERTRPIPALSEREQRGFRASITVRFRPAGCWWHRPRLVPGPPFARAVAVMTHGGSLAVHASLVEREYGIPPVVATGDAAVLAGQRPMGHGPRQRRAGRGPVLTVASMVHPVIAAAMAQPLADMSLPAAVEER